MARQRVPESTTMEAGRRALLARRTSGRGDEDIVLTRARGSLVWDVDGREYIDCTSQAWSNNLGANDPRVIEAAIDQLREIAHIRPVYSSLPLFELSAKLAEIAPPGLDRVAYNLHGSTAVETAMKVSMRNDDLCAQSRDRGLHATKRLREMQQRHPLIGDVRCPGMMVAIELVQDRATREPSPIAAREIARRSIGHGILFGESRYAGLGDIIKIKPPLDIPYEQLDRALDVLDDVIGELEAEGLH